MVLILFFYEFQYGLYAKYCFKNLFLEFKFEDEAIFEGEKTKIKQTFANRKWIPLWWLRVQYMMSSNISFDQLEEKSVFDFERRSEELSLLGYEKLEREITIIANRRGYYKIENMDIICSDLFVTGKFVKKHCVNEGLYVFPKLLSDFEFDIQFNKLLGDIVTKRHLIHDPYERRGIRDYVTSDSLKDVNWMASARSNELKVNVYNYTSSSEILIFLSCQKENNWVVDNVIEEAISIAATIYNEFTKQGVKVGLITDCIDCDTNTNIAVEAGCEPNHGFIFNEGLAKIVINESNEDNISKCIDEEVIKGNKEPLWIVISNATRNGMREAIYNARENECDVSWIIPKEAKTEILLENLNEVLIWDVII